MDQNPYQPPQETPARPVRPVTAAERKLKTEREAYEFVLSAMQMVRVATRSTKIDAVDICGMVLQLAQDTGELPPKRLLAKLGLNSSEHVGQVVHQLVQSGYAWHEGGNLLNEFSGLFDLEMSESDWKVCWYTDDDMTINENRSPRD